MLEVVFLSFGSLLKTVFLQKARICCMAQETEIGALYQSRGVG